MKSVQEIQEMREAFEDKMKEFDDIPRASEEVDRYTLNMLSEAVDNVPVERDGVNVLFDCQIDKAVYVLSSSEASADAKAAAENYIAAKAGGDVLIESEQMAGFKHRRKAVMKAVKDDDNFYPVWGFHEGPQIVVPDADGRKKITPSSLSERRQSVLITTDTGSLVRVTRTVKHIEYPGGDTKVGEIRWNNMTVTVKKSDWRRPWEGDATERW